MPARTLPEILTEIRTYLDDPDGDTFTSDQLLVTFNRAIGYYDTVLTTQAKQIFMTNKDITHDGSELQRILPYLPRIVSIERTSSSPRSEIHPMWMGFKDRFKYLGSSILDTNLVDSSYNRYYIQNNQLGSLPTVASGTDRVWVALATPQLHYGEVTSYTTSTKALVVQALAPSTDTEHLGELISQDDSYNEMPIIFHSTRELNTVTDYAQSTRTMTLAFTQETAPSLNDNYSILPRIHPNHQGTLIWHTVKLLRASQDEDTGEAQSLENEAKREMLAYYSDPALTQGTEYVDMTQEWAQ
tara:strand:- start:192 stop:1091 length:900 start_codon:yes stop_codon:yes gene_type:complete